MNLKENEHPFYLNADDIKWIRETMDNMTIEEKLGQLIFAYGYSHEREYLDFVVNKLKPGGVMFRSGKKDIISKSHDYLKDNMKIPLFLSANLESGGDGIIEEGTKLGNNMLVGATGDPDYAYKLGGLSAKEGREAGINMSFSPVIDINTNFRNSAVNVRSFGDDPNLVETMGRSFCKGMTENKVVPTIKHFPGDGVDARDQHAVTSYNNLGYDKWMDTFGRVYNSLIKDGACSLMVGHIAFPGYYEKFHSEVEEAETIPASVSKELLQELLREKLNYKGMIMTDSTLMSGINWTMPRRELVPEFIISGCDMILFTKDPVEDFRFLMEAYEDGKLSEARVTDALIKILSLKAKMKLYENEEAYEEVDYKKSVELAKEIADRGVTLVRDKGPILPITLEKHRRILLHTLGNDTKYNEELKEYFINSMIEKGFSIECIDYTNETPADLRRSDKYYTDKYDLIVYLANKNVISNQTHLNLELRSPLGIDSPWLVNQIPTIFISLASPYHSYDFPMIKTMINGYFPSKIVIDKVIEKIMTEKGFKGKSPVNLKNLY